MFEKISLFSLTNSIRDNRENKHTSGFGGSQKTWRYLEDRILNILEIRLSWVGESSSVQLDIHKECGAVWSRSKPMIRTLLVL